MHMEKIRICPENSMVVYLTHPYTLSLLGELQWKRHWTKTSLLGLGDRPLFKLWFLLHLIILSGMINEQSERGTDRKTSMRRLTARAKSIVINLCCRWIIWTSCMAAQKKDTYIRKVCAPILGTSFTKTSLRQHCSGIVEPVKMGTS